MEYKTKGLEEILKEAQKDKRKNLAKTIGWSTAPVLYLGGLGVLGGLIASPIENNDLRYLVGVGIGIGAGVFTGYSGMIGDYIDQFMDFASDLKYSFQRVKDIKKELKILNIIYQKRMEFE